MRSVQTFPQRDPTHAIRQRARRDFKSNRRQAIFELLQEATRTVPASIYVDARQNRWERSFFVDLMSRRQGDWMPRKKNWVSFPQLNVSQTTNLFRRPSLLQLCKKDSRQPIAVRSHGIPEASAQTRPVPPLWQRAKGVPCLSKIQSSIYLPLHGYSCSPKATASNA